MTTIFSNYFEVIRQRLTVEGKIGASFHNTTNIGNIREAFVRELLQNNTSQFCSIGSGEIIHPNMTKDEKRNQIDVILYNNHYPQLMGAGGVNLYLTESIFSFIEIKSILKKFDIEKAVEVSKRIKSYPYAPPQRLNPTGVVRNPRLFSFIFAYETEASDIKQVLKWMKEIAGKEDYNLDSLRAMPAKDRHFFPHSFLDGVFVLNKGCVFLDGGIIESPIVRDTDTPLDHIWLYFKERELEVFWVILNLINASLLWNLPSIENYPGEMSVFSSH